MILGAVHSFGIRGTANLASNSPGSWGLPGVWRTMIVDGGFHVFPPPHHLHQPRGSNMQHPSTSTAYDPAPDHWVRFGKIRQTLGLGEDAARDVIARGHIGVRRLPGCQPRYCLDDALRLLQSSTSLARTSSVN
jgi:hypothetical protein